mmetsp:Transcript_18763/g.71405  ORF Transcript_18763/g.71405 Transcript_18763/m.71405 type:complete len:295 (+) Transcript_18763:70-954(+)
MQASGSCRHAATQPRSHATGTAAQLCHAGRHPLMIGITLGLLAKSLGTRWKRAASGLNSGVSTNCRKRFPRRLRKLRREACGLPLASRSASRSMSSTISRVRPQSNSFTVHLTCNSTLTRISADLPPAAAAEAATSSSSLASSGLEAPPPTLPPPAAAAAPAAPPAFISFATSSGKASASALPSDPANSSAGGVVSATYSALSSAARWLKGVWTTATAPSPVSHRWGWAMSSSMRATRDPWASFLAWVRRPSTEASMRVWRASSWARASLRLASLISAALILAVSAWRQASTSP